MMDEQINIPFIIILLETKYLISFNCWDQNLINEIHILLFLLVMSKIFNLGVLIYLNMGYFDRSFGCYLINGLSYMQVEWNFYTQIINNLRVKSVASGLFNRLFWTISIEITFFTLFFRIINR